jgi:membrane protein YqaA with SNARE-associated domain
MLDYTNGITIAILIFALVYLLNLMPAFAPPTWMTLSYVGLTTRGIDATSLALVGATAATLGRVTLANLSHVLIRQTMLSEATRQNVDAIKDGIKNRKGLTFSGFLAFSFSPLPSNYLFIAYGLTALPIVYVAIPFFVGRLISYFFWIKTASSVGNKIQLDSFESASYFGAYFILSQLLLIPLIYSFTRVDWHALFAERKLRWLKKAQ